ncbi:hypothetical protein [Mycobacterium sp. TKK-01-0059]|uniref:hypothetical protein n=1 Tax=Mycobacterium sp. TKK-01-0059 TaxID=1324269 RepID=UPI0012DC48E3|nr:hypothetical protein [Mycobacterium sp. TKK-01-0059]
MAWPRKLAASTIRQLTAVTPFAGPIGLRWFPMPESNAGQFADDLAAQLSSHGVEYGTAIEIAQDLLRDYEIKKRTQTTLIEDQETP